MGETIEDLDRLFSRSRGLFAEHTFRRMMISETGQREFVRALSAEAVLQLAGTIGTQQAKAFRDFMAVVVSILQDWQSPPPVCGLLASPVPESPHCGPVEDRLRQGIGEMKRLIALLEALQTDRETAHTQGTTG